MKNSSGLNETLKWLRQTNRSAFKFQIETWQHIYNNESGLVNAPTGCGKTYSVFLGSIIKFINNNPADFQVTSYPLKTISLGREYMI